MSNSTTLRDLVKADSKFTIKPIKLKFGEVNEYFIDDVQVPKQIYKLCKKIHKEEIERLREEKFKKEIECAEEAAQRVNVERKRVKQILDVFKKLIDTSHTQLSERVTDTHYIQSADCLGHVSLHRTGCYDYTFTMSKSNSKVLDSNAYDVLTELLDGEYWFASLDISDGQATLLFKSSGN